MTDEQPPRDPTESEQPVVAMRDLSDGTEGAGSGGAASVGAASVGAASVGGAGVDPASAGADPAYQALALPNSRERMAGGVFLLLSAISIVAALFLPLYSIVSQPSFAAPNGDGGLLNDVTFQITPWGLTRPPGFGTGDFGVLQLLVGPAPQWGIPLGVIALLLAVSGGALAWRRQASLTMPAVVASVALFTGCVVAMGTFLLTAIQGYTVAGVGVGGALGPSFWVLIFALVLALVGAFLGYRNQPDRAAQPVEREEPDTPALGFPISDIDRRTTEN